MKNTTNQRNTRQRQVILEELRKVKTHPTASQLYLLVQRRMPKISLGTVYRNLEILCRMGSIMKLELSSSEARYDGTVEPHDHLRCMYCGRLDDAPSTPIELSDFSKEEQAGYKVFGHRLELIGICPKCRHCQTKIKHRDVPECIP